VVTNLQIKFIKSLHLKKNRLEHRQYICEGEKIIQELIQYQPKSIEAIYVKENCNISLSTKGLNVISTNAKDMERMSHHAAVPTVIALVNFPKRVPVKMMEQKFHLYLDQVSDPGNLGTIIRTADWYGHKQIFISPNCVDIYNPKVIQSSMGSHFRVQCTEIDFDNLTQNFKFKQILGTAMSGDNIENIVNIKQSLVVMGNESQGISKEILEKCQKRITIPSFGQTESLNVAVATGIILHHFSVNA